MSSTSQDSISSDLRSLRLWLGIGGVLAVITGIVLLLWPGITAAVVTVIIAVYAIIGGIVYLCASLFSSLGGWAKIGHALVALVFIVAGVIAFMNPATSATILAAIVVTFVAISWIFEGIAALATLGLSSSKGWTVFYAIVSILGGIALLIAPLVGASVLIMWIGITLIVMGVVGVIRAFTLGRD